MGGIFDKIQSSSESVVVNESTIQPNEQKQAKEDFKELTPTKTASKPRSGLSDALKSQDAAEGLIDKFNGSMGGNGDIDKELAELDAILPEDIELLSQMVFKGYAEKVINIPNLKDAAITICTSSAEDVSLIDDIIFDIVKQYEVKDSDTLDIPQQYLTTMRHSVNMALYYKGINGVDICDNSNYQLQTIKSAIKKLSSHRSTGELEASKKLFELIKKSINARVSYIRQIPTVIIDFISNQKYRFDMDMNRVMNTSNALPKS